MEIMEMAVPEDLKGEIGLLKKMLEAKSRQENSTDTSLDAIKTAVLRPKLAGLIPGDVLIQKSRGADPLYRWADRPVVFVDYVEDWDTMRDKRGFVEIDDIVVAVGVDKRDGELKMVRVNSSFFEIQGEDGVAV